MVKTKKSTPVKKRGGQPSKNKSTKSQKQHPSSSLPPPTYITTVKETRQDHPDKHTFPATTQEQQQQQRQGIDQDPSFTDDYLNSYNNTPSSIDQLHNELKLQESVIQQKQTEIQKWQQILQTQRTNIDSEVQKWQTVLNEATRVQQIEYQEGIRKWKTALADAIVEREVRYEHEMKVWQTRLDGAHTIQEYKVVREEWYKLEGSRSVPTDQMKEASMKLSELEANVNVPSKTMKEAQAMMDELVRKRDASTKELSIAKNKLGTKREKKYIKNVMEWQEALKDATERHTRDCAKWEDALKEASNDSKQMKKVQRMLERLLATREMPSKDMEEAMRKLDLLEKEEKDAHGIVLRHAGSTLYKLEEELMRFQGELNVTKKLIGKAVDMRALPNSFDDCSSDEEEEEGDDEEDSHYGQPNCYNWICGLDIAEMSSGGDSR